MFVDYENHFFHPQIIFLVPKSLIFIEFHHILTHFHQIWSYFDPPGGSGGAGAPPGRWHIDGPGLGGSVSP